MAAASARGLPGKVLKLLQKAQPEYSGKLGEDPGFSREAVLRAATIAAAYELHEDDVTGSIEVGKFADLIVLDRNPLKIPAEDIAKSTGLGNRRWRTVRLQISAPTLRTSVNGR